MPTTDTDTLYLRLKGAREKLCVAQTLAPRAWQSDVLGGAIDAIDRVGAELPQWSRFDQPEPEACTCPAHMAEVVRGVRCAGTACSEGHTFKGGCALEPDADLLTTDDGRAGVLRWEGDLAHQGDNDERCGMDYVVLVAAVVGLVALGALLGNVLVRVLG